MSSGVRGLLAIAALGALIGAGAIAALQATADTTTAWGEIRTQFAGVFAGGTWGWALRIALLATGIAAVLTVADFALGIRRGPAHHEFDSHTGENVRDVILEVKRRIGHCTDEATDVVAAFSELVRGAVKVAASDIHISPTGETVKLTYRVHGTL